MNRNRVTLYIIDVLSRSVAILFLLNIFFHLFQMILFSSYDWELFDLLADVYFNNEEYSKYITMIGNYILDNQLDMDLIPVGSLSKTSKHIAN